LLLSKLCAVIKRTDDSMGNVAVMSGLRVLVQRAGLAAAYFCFHCPASQFSLKAIYLNRKNQKKFILSGGLSD